MRNGEDDVEVVHRNQVAGARRDPDVARARLALGAVTIAAGVERAAEDRRRTRGNGRGAARAPRSGSARWRG